MEKIAKTMMTPKQRELEGRGLAVRFSSVAYDIVVMSLYCHVRRLNPEEPPPLSLFKEGGNNTKTQSLPTVRCQHVQLGSRQTEITFTCEGSDSQMVS